MCLETLSHLWATQSQADNNNYREKLMLWSLACGEAKHKVLIWAGVECVNSVPHIFSSPLAGSLVVFQNDQSHRVSWFVSSCRSQRPRPTTTCTTTTDVVPRTMTDMMSVYCYRVQKWRFRNTCLKLFETWSSLWKICCVCCSLLLKVDRLHRATIS